MVYATASRSLPKGLELIGKLERAEGEEFEERLVESSEMLRNREGVMHSSSSCSPLRPAGDAG